MLYMLTKLLGQACRKGLWTIVGRPLALVLCDTAVLCNAGSAYITAALGG